MSGGEHGDLVPDGAEDTTRIVVQCHVGRERRAEELGGNVRNAQARPVLHMVGTDIVEESIYGQIAP